MNEDVVGQAVDQAYAAGYEDGRRDAAEKALREAAEDYLNGGVVSHTGHRHYVSGWLSDRAAAVASHQEGRA